MTSHRGGYGKAVKVPKQSTAGAQSGVGRLQKAKQAPKVKKAPR